MANRNHRTKLACILLAAGLVLPTTAASTAWANTGLTDAAIEAFMDSMEDVRAWSKDVEGVDFSNAGGGVPNPPVDATMAAAVDHVREAGHADALDEIVTRHGYADAADWAQTGDRILQAYIAVQLTTQEPDAWEQQEQILERLKRDPDLSDAERAALIDEVERRSGPFLEMAEGVPGADRDAVQPHLNSLEERAFNPPAD